MKILDAIKRDIRQKYAERMAHLEKIKWQKNEMLRLI